MLAQVVVEAPAPPVEVPQVEIPPVIVDTGPPWGEIYPVVVISVFIIACALVLYPLARAWARRIEGRHQDPMLMDELAHLRERVADVDAMAARMHELEERVDFTERLLLQRDAAQLPPDGRR